MRERVTLRRLLLAPLIAAPLSADAAELLFDGHYRARAQGFNSLSLADPDINANAEGGAAYIDHRLRLQPTFLLSDRVSITTQLDLLPYVLWGDEAVQRAAADPGQDLSAIVLSDSVQPPTEDGASTLANIQVTRVYGEIQTDYGQLRFGRMPLAWGAGMVFNAGNDPWQEFGDTVDRIQFTGRAGQIYLQGGLETNAEQFINEGDDVWGISGMVLYQTEQASIGSYNLFRRYNYDESTFGLFTTDLWAEAQAGPLHIETELAAQLGRGDLSDGIDDAGVSAFGAMIDASMQFDRLTLGLTGGVATGDKDNTDKQYKTFSFDPDFNQTLFMFEEPMPTLLPTVQNEANAGRDLSAARTGYALSNALYGRPHVGYAVTDTLDADVSFFIARTAAVPDAETEDTFYGSEVNARVIWSPYAHFTLDTTVGMFLPGTYYSNFTDDDLGGNFDQPAVGAQVLGTIQF
ncbi:MAG: hypothetical protein ACI8S6_003150 [Myxococcota bacterium]|jgi:hypothetical protein